MSLKLLNLLKSQITEQGWGLMWQNFKGTDTSFQGMDFKTGKVLKKGWTNKNIKSKFSKTLVVGGQEYATKDWMKKEWEKAGLSSKNVIFINWDESSEFKKIFKDENVKRIMGFSAGGVLIWDEILKGTSKYDFVGLIDPTTYKNHYEHFIDKNGNVKKQLPPNVYSLSNFGNWFQYPDIQDRLEVLEKKGLLKTTGKSHNAIPNEFFTKYKYELSTQEAENETVIYDYDDTSSEYTPKEKQLVDIAKKYTGTKYLMGGCDLKNGIDCSCYIQQVFKEFGVSKIPRTSRGQWKEATSVSKEDLRPGDLLFVDTDRLGTGNPINTIDHVMMVISPRGSKSVDVIHAEGGSGVNVDKDIFNNSFYKKYITHQGRFDLGLDEKITS
jgi:cell wall-associated NlpC family hydrolase